MGDTDYTQGYNDGYDDGYADGRTSGYKQGYADALDLSSPKPEPEEKVCKLCGVQFASLHEFKCIHPKCPNNMH
ncbi:MAG: hypothetical protein P4L79_10860 [Legionella sp.]|uniref:hypothetical protein n=1 Tax=Legionella sp. TaxID=459 RepID=UPI00284A9034|nr:hypothetical protein [Legionella sp.]